MIKVCHRSRYSNPKFSMSQLLHMANVKEELRLGNKSGRRPSPRKLEPDEVVAKLKARKSQETKCAST